MASANLFGSAQAYWLDAWQRSILMLDILRKRGNTYWERTESAVPNVLRFKAELVRDGRTLPRPVNYFLVQIIPPDDVTIDPAKPPFVVVDPRAGHGPGIGGMKQDSEIGEALAAGHTCYFIGFLPEPVPGQTIEDVVQAEAAFIKDVAARHPQSESKPVIIANCQAGWQTMMMAAVNPGVAGAIMLAGTPLSYWAGVRGKNPLRYNGGVLGGSWLTILAGDLGCGIFDGANLVANFEAMNPANTHWDKPYNVYSKVDTEGPRFLEFETWWGSPVLLNACEMQWIADNLFIGNKLATGALRTSDGIRIDLRNIRSPIIVFCSWGDDITPPQQALDWITDIYESEREIIGNGQTIVYTLHQSIGHLGIFVSGKVANKEHSEFTSCMGLIELLPPGLYEAVITEVDADTENPELIDGRYLFKLQMRTLDDIRALGANSPEDDLRFATAARVSEVNEGLYREFAQPVVRAMSSEPMAEAIRLMHPNRLRFAAFSDRNPLMRQVEGLARAIREERQPVRADNPLLGMEQAMSSWISTSLQVYGGLKDAMTEATFLRAYGSPLLQAMVGLHQEEPAGARPVERDLAREAYQARKRAEIQERFDVGGPTEAALRAICYVRLPDGSVDERAFVMLKSFLAVRPAGQRPALAELKAVLREQFLLVLFDEERAVKAIPALLPKSADERRELLGAVHKAIASKGALSPECASRLARIKALFDVKPARPAKEETVHV